MQFEKQFREVNFSFAYYIANFAQNIISDPLPYMRNLEGCFGDVHLICFTDPYPKYTALHKFISYLIEALAAEWMEEDISNGKKTVWYEYAFLQYNISHEPFSKWLGSKRLDNPDLDKVYEYLSDFSDEVEILIDSMTEDIFHLMFSNRKFLKEFSCLVSGYVRDGSADEENFKRDGVLKRARIPNWSKKAVFFRDRGRCCFCNRDLTNLTSLSNQAHYDHIVPLKLGGINDVINMQLLCSDCNSKKGGNDIATSSKYEKWF